MAQLKRATILLATTASHTSDEMFRHDFASERKCLCSARPLSWLIYSRRMRFWLFATHNRASESRLPHESVELHGRHNGQPLNTRLNQASPRPCLCLDKTQYSDAQTSMGLG